MKNTKTEMIKCTLSNKVHKLLNPNPVKNSERWKQKNVKLSDKEKIELFDIIVSMDKETSRDLGYYWFKRRESKRVNKKRILNGYVPKRKTTKKEYDEMLMQRDFEIAKEVILS